VKRIVFVFLCLFGLVFFWQDLLGLVLKGAVRWNLKANLAYRDLHIEEGQIVLEDAVLFDVSGGKSAYLLSAESVKITWEESLSFFVQIDECALTLSCEIFKRRAPTSSRFATRIEIPNGTLDWSDRFLPPANFSLVDQKLDVSWQDRGTLGIYKTIGGYHASGSHLSLEMLLPQARGIVGGSIDVSLEKGKVAALKVQAEGKDLSCTHASYSWGGSFAVDWAASDIASFQVEPLLTATDQLSFKLEKGSLFLGDAELIQEGVFDGSFQAGLGGNWQAHAETIRGFSLTANGQALPGEPLRLEGTGRLGQVEVTLTQSSGSSLLQSDWQLGWKGLGPEEAACIQEIALRFNPKLPKGEWIAGTASGALRSDLHGNWQCETFLADDFVLRLSNLYPTWCKDVEAACKHLSFHEGLWTLEGIRIKTDSAIEFQGQGQFEWGESRKGSLEGTLSGSEVRLFYDQANIFGSIGEFFFDGTLNRKKLSIPRFGGKIPPWISELEKGLELVSGRVSSLQEGLVVDFGGNWSLACKMDNGLLAISPQFLGFTTDLFSVRLDDFQCELYANAQGLDILSLHAVTTFAMGERAFVSHLSAPRIHWLRDQALFDVRLFEKEWDYLRIKGEAKEGALAIDSSRSFFLGQPLQVTGTSQKWHCELAIPWRLLESLLKKKGTPIPFGEEFNGILKLTADGGGDHPLSDMNLSLSGIDWTLRGRPISLQAECLVAGGLWSVPSFVCGPLTARCNLGRDPDGWLLQKGVFHCGEALSFDFEGKCTDAIRLNVVIDQLKGDLSKINHPSLKGRPLLGTLEGKGCLVIHTELEADLDVSVKDLVFGDYAIENSGPLYLSMISAGSALIKGVECKIGVGDLEAHATTDLLEIDWEQSRLKAKKVRALIPTNFLGASIFDPNREIVLFGNAEFKMDGTDWTCELQEGFLPLGGAVRHVKECSIGSDVKSYVGSGRLFHHAQEAVFSWKIQRAQSGFVNLESHQSRPSLVDHSEALQNSQNLTGRVDNQKDAWKGRVVLQESDKLQSLMIEGSYKPLTSGLSIDFIEGAFGGLSASFRSVEEMRLVGSMEIDFATLSRWIPPAVAEVFHDLEMGSGYELKGHLSLVPDNISFQGLFCGKEIDLFGYQFKTLMAQADLTPHRIQLTELLISDAAGSLVIPELLIEGASDPWTIGIPLLTIRDLRPSLLQKPGEEKKALTPLVVRELKIHNFRGLLEDGATYKANGDLVFINSFKRGKSVFDLPTHLFGRIVGLDLELLIPVEGQLFFELDKGYFTLTDLKEAFSEGRRSQFFLADQEIVPRMSLKGDLEIFVRMKQFVLFALTEAFMISIDGKLSDPQFRLQKKKSFL